MGEQQVPLYCVRDLRARRYILRVRRDGSIRVTLPRGGSTAFALAFAYRNRVWIQKQLDKRQAECAPARPWSDGTPFLFRGENVTLKVQVHAGIALVQFADQTLGQSRPARDLRASVEAHLWGLAEKELVPRTFQIAAKLGAMPRRVVVRNQRSRWGSCSVRGTISLNWRLIQAPAWVRDYLIVHELMHLQQMNHTPRFWSLVAGAFPGYRAAESWLDEHAALLR